MKEFKSNSEYRMKEGGVQNAFDLVEVVVEETALVEEQGGLEEEELGRYYDDLEDEFEQEEKEWCDFC